MSECSAADASAVTEAPERTDRPASAAAWWLLAICLAAVVASGLQIWSGQREYGFYLLSLCFLVCIAAGWLDLATRRIPNLLTYPAILIGLGLNVGLAPTLDSFGADAGVVWLGAPGVVDCLQGFGLCAAIGIVSFIARGLGGGDVKILAAVGAMLGFDAVVAVLFNTLLVAFVFGVANWAAKGSLMARAQIIAGNFLTILVTRKRMDVYPFKATEAPFGLALLIGLTLAQFFAIHRYLLTVSW